MVGMVTMVILYVGVGWSASLPARGSQRNALSEPCHPARGIGVPSAQRGPEASDRLHGVVGGLISLRRALAAPAGRTSRGGAGAARGGGSGGGGGWAGWVSTVYKGRWGSVKISTMPEHVGLGHGLILHDRGWSLLVAVGVAVIGDISHVVLPALVSCVVSSSVGFPPPRASWRVRLGGGGDRPPGPRHRIVGRDDPGALTGLLVAGSVALQEGVPSVPHPLDGLAARRGGGNAGLPQSARAAVAP